MISNYLKNCIFWSSQTWFGTLERKSLRNSAETLSIVQVRLWSWINYIAFNTFSWSKDHVVLTGWDLQIPKGNQYRSAFQDRSNLLINGQVSICSWGEMIGNYFFLNCILWSSQTWFSTLERNFLRNGAETLSIVQVRLWSWLNYAAFNTFSWSKDHAVPTG